MKFNKKTIIIIGVLIFILAGLIFSGVFESRYLKKIKYDEVINKINNKESFVLLLSQTSCDHCKAFKPRLAKVAKEYELVVYYLETDLLDKETYNDLKKHFSFTGTPTTVFVKDGEEKTAATRINGEVSVDKIISKFKSNGFID